MPAPHDASPRWMADDARRGEAALLDPLVRRARDLRYVPDEAPLAGDFALVDLVLGVESFPGPAPRGDVTDGHALRTHWTRILAHDLDTNDERFAARPTRGTGWKLVAKASVALVATYVVVCLMVMAAVYVARAPDAASALLPDAPSPAQPARSDFPIDAPNPPRIA